MIRLFCIFLLAMSLSSCALFTNKWDSTFLLNENYRAVDQMLLSLNSPHNLSKNQPILVANIVNIDDLSSSRFGKTIAEHMVTRFTQNGYPVIEVKLRNNIFVKQPDGELMLSREIKDISQNHKAQAVVVGTYADSQSSVYVSAKIVSLVNNSTMAAFDYVIPNNPDIRYMLRSATRY